MCALLPLNPTGCHGQADHQFAGDDPQLCFTKTVCNVAKIEPQRVWRYVVTDHASGRWVYVEYVFMGDQGEPVHHFHQRHAAALPGGSGMVHWVMVMLDLAANTGAVFKNLC